MSTGTPHSVQAPLDPATTAGRVLSDNSPHVSAVISGRSTPENVLDLPSLNESDSQSGAADGKRASRSDHESQHSTCGSSHVTSSPRSRARNVAEWECVDILRAGPNPRWRCKSCRSEYTGAPRRIAQHILGAGGGGQIKPCPCPQQDHVTLLEELMALDCESGRLVKKPRSVEDVIGSSGGSGGASGSGGSGASLPASASEVARPGSSFPVPALTKSLSPPQALQQLILPDVFEVFVGKEDFKFSSSHFIAFENYRERLHGHNYAVSVRLTGQVCDDGYVVDFGMVKQKTRKLCKELNERFLCPTKSDVLDITIAPSQVSIVCQDGSTFVMPSDDCALLPLVHSSAEELAYYFFTRLLKEFSLDYLHSRGVTYMEISVSEMPRQEATFKGKIPLSKDLIRDPPLSRTRRTHGCCVRDDENGNVVVSASGGAGAGGGAERVAGSGRVDAQGAQYDDADHINTSQSRVPPTANA